MQDLQCKLDVFQLITTPRKTKPLVDAVVYIPMADEQSQIEILTSSVVVSVSFLIDLLLFICLVNWYLYFIYSCDFNKLMMFKMIV